MSRNGTVGPVLSRSTLTDNCIKVIKNTNKNVKILDRGAYIRVLAANQCILNRDLLEKEMGESIQWPEALEAIMPSFKGKLSITDEHASWTYKSRNGGA